MMRNNEMKTQTKTEKSTFNSVQTPYIFADKILINRPGSLINITPVCKLLLANAKVLSIESVAFVGLY